MLTTSVAVAQPRRAVATDRLMFPRPATECASAEQTIRAPAPAGHEAADVRVAQGMADPRGHLARRHALSCVNARLDPVELREYVVGEVERAVGEDVAFDPAEHSEWREGFVGGGDLLALAANRVGVETPDRAHGGRVIADGQVLIAALACRIGPSPRCSPARRTTSNGNGDLRGCSRAPAARAAWP